MLNKERDQVQVFLITLSPCMKCINASIDSVCVIIRLFQLTFSFAVFLTVDVVQ